MVKIKVKRGDKIWTYDYKDKSSIRYLVNKELNEKFNLTCDEFNLDKGKIVEELMKRIIIKFKDNSLNQSNGYLTIDLNNAKSKSNDGKVHS